MASNQGQLVPLDNVKSLEVRLKGLRQRLKEESKKLAGANNSEEIRRTNNTIDTLTLLVKSRKQMLDQAKARKERQPSGSDFTLPKQPDTPLPVPVGGTDGGDGSGHNDGDFYSASEETPDVGPVAVADAERNKPVAAFPSEDSRGLRRRESSRSEPLRYSAAALGIRVMSAAESAERAAVNAADAERRANFFRANGLAP